MPSRKTVSRKGYTRKGHFQKNGIFEWVPETKVKATKAKKPKSHNRKAHERDGHFKEGGFFEYVKGGHVHATKIRPPSQRSRDRKSRYKRRPNSRKKATAYHSSRQGKPTYRDFVKEHYGEARSKAKRKGWIGRDLTQGTMKILGKMWYEFTGGESRKVSKARSKGRHGYVRYQDFVRDNYATVKNDLREQGMHGRELTTGILRKLGEIWKSSEGIKGQKSRSRTKRAHSYRRQNRRGVLSKTGQIAKNTERRAVNMTKGAWDVTGGQVTGMKYAKSYSRHKPASRKKGKGIAIGCMCGLVKGKTKKGKSVEAVVCVCGSKKGQKGKRSRRKK